MPPLLLPFLLTCSLLRREYEFCQFSIWQSPLEGKLSYRFSFCLSVLVNFDGFSVSFLVNFD